MSNRDIDLNEYDYSLPSDRIAQYPCSERDMSKLLIYGENSISNDTFRNIDNYIPEGSLLVFNNTRVIRARLLFQKETGALIEVLCLEPLSPIEYELSLGSRKPVEWKCIVGNLKKWKGGTISTFFNFKGEKYVLTAEKTGSLNDASRIRFTWNNASLSFGEVIEATGHIPLPPYICREDEEADYNRYQTVYSRIRGSVAAPTAGLHFTDHVFEKLERKGIKTAELTLHVGAGTFQPVKSDKITDHEMHCEHFFVTAETLRLIIANHGKIIAVGTTSVRTLESLYWLGVKAMNNQDSFSNDPVVGQWEPYEETADIPVEQALGSLIKLLERRSMDFLHASTSIIIIPGYKFRMISGMVTNFHQPRSTLLLLISAWLGKSWKKVYGYALGNGFRFLSYGDSSLLIR